MMELEFTIVCLDGRYCFSCKAEESFNYETDTDINGLECVQGELDEEKANEFVKLINEAEIEKWDREYCGENPIEDGIEWSLKYINNDKEYMSCGKESFEPYRFEYLLKAIKLCDKQLEYFGW